MIPIIVCVLFAQLCLLAAIKSRGLLTYWLIAVALSLLVVIQILKNGSDPNLDPVIFATTYTGENINNPILIGRHYLIPYIASISAYIPHFLAHDPFRQLSLTIFIISLLFAVASLIVIPRKQSSSMVPRAIPIFFIFALSCPSSILLLNNFISQSLSAMLCIAAFCILDYEDKKKFSAKIFAVILMLVALINHSSALYLIALYAFQLVLLVLTKRLSYAGIPLSKFLLTLGVAMLSTSYVLLISFISAFLMANDATTDYTSGFDEATPERLIVRIIYPYVIAAVVFAPSKYSFKLALDSTLLRVSLFGSLSAILIYYTGIKGVAWRLEYYASFLAAFGFCSAYCAGAFSPAKSLLKPIRIVMILSLTIIPYFYPNVARLFI